MNVFIVKANLVITPPVTENILEGITRRTIIELATQELGLPVVERPIDRTEVYLCDELFLTGTQPGDGSDQVDYDWWATSDGPGRCTAARTLRSGSARPIAALPPLETCRFTPLLRPSEQKPKQRW